jgi:hypothetical protein
LQEPLDTDTKLVFPSHTVPQHREKPHLERFRIHSWYKSPVEAKHLLQSLLLIEEDSKSPQRHVQQAEIPLKAWTRPLPGGKRAHKTETAPPCL